MVVCPAGHRAYSGYLAEADYLRQRLGWLDERVAAGDVRPDELTAASYGVWPARAGSAAPTVPASVRPTGSPAAEPVREGAGVQVLLLGLGAALLVVAGIVFAAVVWDRLGAGGQVLTMATLTLGFAAMAIRLSPRLPGTAEALAVVAFGLAVIDIMAAPALGLVPDTWLHPDRPYLALLFAGLGAVAIEVGRHESLRAWVWLGWLSVSLSSALFTWWLALGLLDVQPLRGLSVAVVSLSAVQLLTAPFVSERAAEDRGPLVVAGLLAGVTALATGLVLAADLTRAAFLGVGLASLLTAIACAAAWRRTADPFAGLAAAALLGVAGGLGLLMLPDLAAPWLGLLVGVCGVALLVAFDRFDRHWAGLVGAAALWGTWAFGQAAIASPYTVHDPVAVQLAALLVVVAATAYTVAVRGGEPELAWLGAVAGWVAWLLVRPRIESLPEALEVFVLPLALLLLVAGLVWRRARTARAADAAEPGGSAEEVPSLAWLGPAVTAALLPSALACWGAPWVSPISEQGAGPALFRLVTVLAAAVVVVWVGAVSRTAGLLVPGAAALVVVGAAQVWGGAQALPRWIAIGAAGALLLLMGARVEQLRREARRFRSYLGDLR
jgi:hypothetical protein